MDPAGSIILFILLIIASAYFSGTEIALVSVNKIHMMSQAAKGSKSAKRVLYILDNFDEALTVLLIGNNIVNITSATVATLIATRLWGVNAVALSTVITTVIVFLFAEMIPKNFAHSCNEGFACAFSGPLVFLMKVLKPISAFFTMISSLASKPFKKHADAQVTMTEEELTDLVEHISEEDDFDEETGELVKSAMRFSNASVGQIMVPWSEVEIISSAYKLPQILKIVKESVHSRIPVVDRNGNLKGILQVRKYLKAYAKSRHNVVLASVIDYPYYVDSTDAVDEALTAMSNHRRNLAFVRDEEGHLAGILTVEDILEELVGEIYDENDKGGAEE